MLDLLLRLNDSIIGYMSAPELVFGLLALWATALSIQDWQRGRAHLRDVERAIAEGNPAARRLRPRLAALGQRVSSDRIRIRKQAFLISFALVLSVWVPDYVRESLRAGFAYITLGFCLMEVDQIRDLQGIKRTWERINAIVAEDEPPAQQQAGE